MADLTGKRALVTGAASGIGRAVAAVLVDSGAHVMLADISEEAVAKAAAELGAGWLRCDVAEAAEVERAVHTRAGSLGGIDIVVNNAGIEQVYSLVEHPEDEFDRIVAVNLKGVWLGIKYGGPAIAASGGGAIVNTASVAGLRGSPLTGAYGATKAGVVSLTQTAALELRDVGVWVNAVCPGVIDTPMVARIMPTAAPVVEALMGLGPEQVVHNIQGRMGSPAEVADAVAYLASDQASFISGVAFPVDNGVTARWI